MIREIGIKGHKPIKLVASRQDPQPQTSAPLGVFDATCPVCEAVNPWEPSGAYVCDGCRKLFILT